MEYQRASSAVVFTKKLSKGHSFNGNKNMYDGVFGGGLSKPVKSRVEDYAEIFGGSSSDSSIPFLDIPELNDRKFSVEVSSSKLDYSNIFGGFGGFDFAVSHEELLAKPTKDKKKPAKTRSISEGSFSYPSSNPEGNQVSSNDQTPHGSDNGVKQFKMSYNKSSTGSKNGTNGTTHVAQLHAVPGYTCVIEEKITPSKDKPVTTAVNETYQANVEVVMEGMHCKKLVSNVLPNGVSKQASKGVASAVNETYQANREEVMEGMHCKKLESNVLHNGVSKHASKGVGPSAVNETYQANGEEVMEGMHCKKLVSNVLPNGVSKQASKRVILSAVNETYQANGEEVMEGLHCEKPVSNVLPNGVSKQASKGVNELHSEPKSNGSNCNDVLFGYYGVGQGMPRLKMTRASSMSCNMTDNKRDSLKFGVFRSYSLDGDADVSSPPAFDEEIDVNSVAATSAAAVKKAIEEAQARLEVAKQKMERRKEGHIGRVKPGFSGSLKAKERKKGKSTFEQNNFRQDKAKETCEKIAVPVQTSAGIRNQNMMKVGNVPAVSEDRNRSSVVREVAEGICAKNFRSSKADCRQEEVVNREAANEGERERDVTQALNGYEGEEKKIIEKPEEYGKKLDVHVEAAEQDYDRKLYESEELQDKEECLQKLNPTEEIHDQKEDETKLRIFKWWEETEDTVSAKVEACESKLKHPEKTAEDDRKVYMQELKDNYNLERLTVAMDVGDKQKHVLKQENGFASGDVFRKVEDGMQLEDVSTIKEIEEIHEEAIKISELNGEDKEACGSEENNEIEEDACNREDTEQISYKMEIPEIIEPKHKNSDYKNERDRRVEEKDDFLGNEEFMEAEESGDLFKYACQMEAVENNDSLGNEEFMEAEESGDLFKYTYHMEAAENDVSLGNEEFMEAEESGDLFKYTYQMEALEQGQKESPGRVAMEEMRSLTDQEADETTQARGDALDCCPEDLELASDAYYDNEINIPGETLETSVDEDSCVMTPELFVNEENGGIGEANKAYSECKESRRVSEAVEVDNDLVENVVFDKVDSAESSLKVSEIDQQPEDTIEAFDFDGQGINIDEADVTFEQNQYEQQSIESETISTVGEQVEKLAREIEDVREAELGLKQEESKFNLEIPDEGIDSRLHFSFREKYETTQIAHEIETSQRSEYNESQHETSTTGEAKISSQEEIKVVKEQQRRVDEAKEKKKEREKERIAVERAIREARERAFAEARERAAVAGRTNVEAQRKVKSDAQGESAKPSVEASDKIMEAKLKAERAAVERATAEARQRALEKALSEKVSSGARKQAEISSDAKQSFQYYDSSYKGSYPSAPSRNHNSSNQIASKSSEGLDGATGESAQRRKARLERHQRTAERAAKALAEKNKRDLLAQKEQAERNRLAETLDAEVKRWSNGKQGNLRALLSTLQYILGSDSGWKPVPLTDIIATAAVKKAYRKATLCVHPDKLQQRGASIPQKYTCEKVFDLLKEAWNKFSAEER